MHKSIALQTLSLFIVMGLLFSSCGDIGITKRRHLPGYHVDFVKKKKRDQPMEEARLIEERTAETSVLSKEANEVPTADAQEEFRYADVPELTASKKESLARNNSKSTQNSFNQLLGAPFQELRKEKLNGELKRAVFNDEDEKHGWSILSFISTGLGAVGLAMVIVGLAFLVSFIFAGGVFYWWIFALVGLLLGIAAMVTGIISMRQTGSGEKRGRGFALAGMISGIVTLALGLIGLFWGLLYYIINNIGQ